jgi:hypothetical protein
MKKRGPDTIAARDKLLGLRSTRDPSDPCWELRVRPAEGYRLLLVGWVMSSPPLDAGVPSSVADLLTRALCRDHRIVFLHPSASAPSGRCLGWRPIEGGWACHLRPGTGGRLRGAPSLPLIGTEQAAVARRMFHADPFRWESRSQMALLFPRGSTLPPLDYPLLLQLWESGTLPRDAFLKLGGTGALLPAVDGDFVEGVFFEEDAREAFERRLEEECQNGRISWESVSEDAFKGTPWVPR